VESRLLFLFAALLQQLQYVTEPLLSLHEGTSEVLSKACEPRNGPLQMQKILFEPALAVKGLRYTTLALLRLTLTSFALVSRDNLSCIELS